MKNTKDKSNNSKRRISIITILFIIIIYIIDFYFGFFTLKIISNDKEVIEDQNTILTIDENVVPKVYFEGEIMDLKTKKDIRNVKFQYIVNENQVYDLYATIKLQGTSSLGYDKKNYTIEFYEDEECVNRLGVDLGFGWGNQVKYCLKANWIDSTHARNIVSARLAAQMQELFGLFEDTPNRGLIDGHPVEVYVNNEYLGLYTCNIPKDAWMFNMDTNNENHIVMCGEFTSPESSACFAKEADPKEAYWSIEVGPDDEEGIKATYEKLNRVIRFVKDSSDEEFKNDFDKYLNKDACLNYLSFIWLCNGIDNIAKNMLFVTYDGNIWYPSLYDLDSTWGLHYYGRETINIYNNFPDDYSEDSRSVLWDRIIECFPEELKERYNYLRQTTLSTENIIYEFEKFINNIPKECYTREQKKWNYVPSKNIGLDQIKEHVTKRGEYVDKVINEL